MRVLREHRHGRAFSGGAAEEQAEEKHEEALLEPAIGCYAYASGLVHVLNEAEQPMKIYPLVRELGRVIAGRVIVSGPRLGLWSSVCALAVCGYGVSGCSADVGTLFPALPESTNDGSQEPPVDPEPLSPEEPVQEPVGVPEDSGEPDDSDLPLDGDGQVPPPPRGEPSETPVEEPPPAPVGPVIVEVSPADGAGSVANDVNIVLRFSEPMDRAATEAAYQSEGIPSSSVFFFWSNDDTTLTIVPAAPLEYPSGSDPVLVEPRRLSYFVSASATSRAGQQLARPYEFSFVLLRQVQLSVFAVQNRDLSGSFRSNDTYGAGQCARNQVNMCVGDVRVGRENDEYRGFISFELGELPESMVGLTATLNLEITGMSGNPFAGLGGLVLEHTRFDAIGLDAFESGPLAEVGLIASSGATGTAIAADVSSAIVDDLSEGGLSQYRLRFEDVTDDDNTSDAILSAWDTQSLVVTYLLP